MNSEPNKEFSILVCFFECQHIGASFKNTKNPVRDLLLEPLPAGRWKVHCRHCGHGVAKRYAVARIKKYHPELAGEAAQ